MARTIPTEAETQKNVYKAANAPAASINRIQPNVLAPSTSTEGQLLPTHSVDAAASEEITIDVGANLRAGVTVGFEGVIRHIYPKTTAAGAGIEVGWRLMIVMMGMQHPIQAVPKSVGMELIKTVMVWIRVVLNFHAMITTMLVKQPVVPILLM